MVRVGSRSACVSRVCAVSRLRSRLPPLEPHVAWRPRSTWVVATGVAPAGGSSRAEPEGAGPGAPGVYLVKRSIKKFLDSSDLCGIGISGSRFFVLNAERSPALSSTIYWRDAVMHRTMGRCSESREATLCSHGHAMGSYQTSYVQPTEPTDRDSHTACRVPPSFALSLSLRRHMWLTLKYV